MQKERMSGLPNLPNSKSDPKVRDELVELRMSDLVDYSMPVRCQATFDFARRQRFLEHFIAHVDSLQAYFMHRLFHSRQVLLGLDCAGRFPCGFLIMVLPVPIDDFHRACDHSFEPAAL